MPDYWTNKNRKYPESPLQTKDESQLLLKLPETQEWVKGGVRLLVWKNIYKNKLFRILITVNLLLPTPVHGKNQHGRPLSVVTQAQ